MPLKLVKRGSIYHLRGTVAGKRVRESTRTRDAENAERIRAETEARLLRADLYGPENEATFADACVLYLQAGGRKRYLEPLLRHLGRKRLKDIKPASLRDLAMKLYPKARYTDSTRNTCVLKPARAVINHAHDRGLCPPIRVKGFREAIVERPAGDRAWIEKFRTVAWEMEPRLAVMALLMFSTAARIGECIAFEPEHLKLDEKKIIGPPGKNGDPGIFHLTDEVVEELRGLTPKAIRYGKGPVRVFGWATKAAVWKPWNAICERAGIRRLTPHEAGRHGFGTEMIVRRKVDIVTTAKGGRWRDPTVLVRRYAHAEGVAEAVNEVFGQLTESGTGLTQPKRRAS